MIRSSLIVLAVVIVGATAHADDPMTREAVVEAARDGIEFVGNAYVQERKTDKASTNLVIFLMRSGYRAAKQNSKLLRQCATRTPKSLSIAKQAAEQRS